MIFITFVLKIALLYFVGGRNVRVVKKCLVALLPAGTRLELYVSCMALSRAGSR